MINALTPMSLLDRFPHLKSEIRQLAKHDPEFQQLAEDYELLIRSLNDSEVQTSGDRQEIIRLKISLEFEALEVLSQSRAGQQP